METLTNTLETFLLEADSWLTPAEYPIVAALRLMARSLDAQAESEGGIVTSLMTTYTRTLVQLHKLKPADPQTTDPLANALANLETR